EWASLIATDTFLKTGGEETCAMAYCITLRSREPIGAKKKTQDSAELGQPSGRERNGGRIAIAVVTLCALPDTASVRPLRRPRGDGGGGRKPPDSAVAGAGAEARGHRSGRQGAAWVQQGWNGSPRRGTDGQLLAARW